MGIYYSNVWRARDFPFLSQLLFSPSSNSTLYQTFNQTAVLAPDGHVDDVLLQQEGVPYMSATFAAYVTTQNLAISATITHLILYNWDDLKSAWSFLSPASLRKIFKAETWAFWKHTKKEPTAEELEAMDPHYRLMLRYTDAPNWRYGWPLHRLVRRGPGVHLPGRLGDGVVGIHRDHAAGYSDDPLYRGAGKAAVHPRLSVLFSDILFQFGLTGFKLPVQPIIQMIGAYLEPGRPLTNMYVWFGAYSCVQLLTCYLWLGTSPCSGTIP